MSMNEWTHQQGCHSYSKLDLLHVALAGQTGVVHTLTGIRLLVAMLL